MRSGRPVMQAGFKGAYDCVKAFSETNSTKISRRWMSQLVLHGDDDQIVPIANSALLSSKIIKKATLESLPGRAARFDGHP